LVDEAGLEHQQEVTRDLTNEQQDMLHLQEALHQENSASRQWKQQLESSTERLVESLHCETAERQPASTTEDGSTTYSDELDEMSQKLSRAGHLEIYVELVRRKPLKKAVQVIFRECFSHATQHIRQADVAPLDSRKVSEARKRLSSLEEENLDLRAVVDEILDETATLEQRCFDRTGELANARETIAATEGKDSPCWST
jgi:hypothetical protein